VRSVYHPLPDALEATIRSRALAHRSVQRGKVVFGDDQQGRGDGACTFIPVARDSPNALRLVDATFVQRARSIEVPRLECAVSVHGQGAPLAVVFLVGGRFAAYGHVTPPLEVTVAAFFENESENRYQ
jgi:hypothetical protein